MVLFAELFMADQALRNIGLWGYRRYLKKKKKEGYSDELMKI